MPDKLNALLKSRRFWVAVASVASIVLKDTVGLDEEQTMNIAAIAIAWILGDSVNKTK